MILFVYEFSERFSNMQARLLCDVMEMERNLHNGLEWRSSDVHFLNIKALFTFKIQVSRGEDVREWPN